MRRDTIDSGSQPVRNLALNPQWFMGSGVNQIVRQNLCWNPSMLGVTGALAQVRINRCINPRGVLTMLHYSGAGAQTITNNVAITGGPEGIATALRFTYGPSASNPGLNIMSPVTANTTYTMSAWVMIESLTSTPGSGGFAENGVISGTNVDNAIIGTWQKITWTRTTTASPGPNFGIRFAAVGGTGTGSILVTGIVIEIADAAGASPTFFDGATAAGGGFTYRWTGAANNSISEQNAPTVGSWSARWFGAGGGSGTTYQSLGTGVGGSVSLRKLWKVANTGNSNDTGVSVNVPVAAGTSYTASIYQNPSFATNLAIFISWLDSGGAQISATSASLGIASPAGVWTRHSATGVAPAGAVNALFVFGPYNTPGPVSSPATPSGATIDWDNCLIEPTNALTNYFDGSFAASGDYTYNWQGTVNGGISREVAPAPALANSTGASYRAAYLSTDRPAGASKFLRVITYTPGTTSLVALNPTDVQIKDGVLRTDLMWVRSSRTMTVGTRYRNPSGSVIVTGASLNLVADQWYLHRVTAAPSGADDMALGLISTTAIQAGDTLDIGPHMTVEGTYTGDYIDGTKPFSKWNGAAHSSVSVGYPPQLLDLAGLPLYDITTTGHTVLNGGFGNTEARTIYTVYSAFVDIPDGTVPILVTYGATALSDAIPNQFLTLRQQLSNNPGNNLIARRTGGNGPLVSRSMVANNVAVWGIDVSGKTFIQVNNEAAVTDSVVMDIPNERIYITPPSTYSSHTRTIIYRGLHDAPTRAAVSRYLGNKYGAQVA